MLQTLSEPISVTLASLKPSGSDPVGLFWAGREYAVTQLGLHHTYRDGRILHHVFSVVAGGLFFRLNLNTENLRWTLEEVSDGNT